MDKQLFEQILLVVDGTEPSDAAIETAGRMAQLGNTRLVVAAVWEPIMVSGGEAGIAETVKEYKAARDHAQRCVDQAERKLRWVGVEAEAQVLEGSAKGAVVEAASRLGADLIILGAEGHGLWQCGLRGCTACFVTRNATCSVLVVRR